MAPKSDTFNPILLRNETQSIHGTEIHSVTGFVQAPAVPRRITRSYRTTTTDPYVTSSQSRLVTTNQRQPLVSARFATLPVLPYRGARIWHFSHREENRYAKGSILEAATAGEPVRNPTCHMAIQIRANGREIKEGEREERRRDRWKKGDREK